MPTIHRRLLGAALLLAAALPVTHLAHASDNAPYPSKPLTIVVPSVAGNVNDAVARLLGQELTKAWGQPVIVDEVLLVALKEVHPCHACATHHVDLFAQRNLKLGVVAVEGSELVVLTQLASGNLLGWLQGEA